MKKTCCATEVFCRSAGAELRPGSFLESEGKSKVTEMECFVHMRTSSQSVSVACRETFKYPVTACVTCVSASLRCTDCKTRR